MRYVGVSNFDVAEMEAFQRGRKLDALQPPYHLFRRDIEAAILPYCLEHGIGVLVYGPMAHGLLTGHMARQTRRSNPATGGRRARCSAGTPSCESSPPSTS